VVSFLSLGYLGMQQPTGTVVVLCRIFTISYFAFFLSMPFYSRIEKTKPVPTRVTP
jgi:ubiquinol-cytochrome c reductase cytochrome b subunit